MKGLMQDWPLLVHKVLDHAAQWHGEREVVSRSVEGPIHRISYGEMNVRVRKLASSVRTRLGVKEGTIIATMAWNGYRHMEIWYAVMGLGGIVHTLNPRLFVEQLVYIINHAEDEWIFTDLTFLPLFEKFHDRLGSVKGFVVMTDAAHMPKETQLKNLICYEELLDEGDTEISWPVLDENTACGLCYTSGTTGNPKGVLYSHRSNVLHAMAMQFNDTQAISSRDRVMPIVPMFHANAWALAFAGPMAGADMIMPGAKLDGASVYELLTQERVTFCAGVPTIYQMLLLFMEQDPARALPDLNRVIIGGSACPESMLRTFVEKYGVEVRHGWGMTETSPVASVNVLKGSMAHLAGEDKWAAMAKQGRPQFTVEMKIAGDAGAEIIHDGKAFGRLHVRGPAIAASYFRSDAKEAFVEDGWFDTGDVATIDAWGFMQITDRSKDVIKSGGEWISSIELENIAAGCEGVAEAAAIGLPHPKWDERPVLIIVSKPGAELSRGQVLAHMAGKVAKWWMPDDVIFVDEIPHTAAGKISKVQLREQFKFHQLLQS